MPQSIDFRNLMTSAFRQVPVWSDFAEETTSVITQQVVEPLHKLSRVRDTTTYRAGDTIRLGVGECTVISRLTIGSAIWTLLQPKNWAYSMYVLDDDLKAYIGVQPSIGQKIKFDAEEKVLKILRSINYQGQYYGVLTVNSTKEKLYANLDNLATGILGNSYIVGQQVQTALGTATISSITNYGQAREDEIYVDSFLKGFGTIRVKLQVHAERHFLIAQAQQLGFYLLSDKLTDYDYQRVVDFVSLYYPESGTENFIKFMGFVLNIRFDIEQMWSNTNVGDDYVLFDAISIGDVPVWQGGIWYPTSHVTLTYDSLQFPNLNIGDTTKIFYELAPIHLYLYQINATIYGTVTFGVTASGGIEYMTYFGYTKI